MNTQNVTVTADILGNVIGISKNNPEYGWIRVESIDYQISSKGWLQPRKRSALIKGLVEDLKQINYQKGDMLPGKIVVKESLESLYEEDPEKGLKYAGNTGIPCKIDDQPIYRETYYTTDMYEEDVLIQHDNGEEIKEAQQALKAMNQLGQLANL